MEKPQFQFSKGIQLITEAFDTQMKQMQSEIDKWKNESLTYKQKV